MKFDLINIMKNTKLLLTLTSIMAFLGMQAFCFYLFLSGTVEVVEPDLFWKLTLIINVLVAYALAFDRFEGDAQPTFINSTLSILITLSFFSTSEKIYLGIMTGIIGCYPPIVAVWGSPIPKLNRLLCLAVVVLIFISFEYLLITEGVGLIPLLATRAEESGRLYIYAKCTSLCLLANAVLLKIFALNYSNVKLNHKQKNYHEIKQIE